MQVIFFSLIEKQRMYFILKLVTIAALLGGITAVGYLLYRRLFVPGTVTTSSPTETKSPIQSTEKPVSTESPNDNTTTTTDVQEAVKYGLIVGLSFAGLSVVGIIVAAIVYVRRNRDLVTEPSLYETILNVTFDGQPSIADSLFEKADKLREEASITENDDERERLEEEAEKIEEQAMKLSQKESHIDVLARLERLKKEYNRELRKEAAKFKGLTGVKTYAEKLESESGLGEKAKYIEQEVERAQGGRAKLLRLRAAIQAAERKFNRLKPAEFVRTDSRIVAAEPLGEGR